MVYHPDYEAGDCFHLTEHVDIFPTLCEFTGTDIPEQVRGKSLKALMDHPSGPPLRDYVISQLDRNVMIRTLEYKLNYYAVEPGELYDLREDPDEFYSRLSDAENQFIFEKLNAYLERDHPDLWERVDKHLKANRHRRQETETQDGAC